MRNGCQLIFLIYIFLTTSCIDSRAAVSQGAELRVRQAIMDCENALESAIQVYSFGDERPTDIADAAMGECDSEFNKYSKACRDYYLSSVSPSGFNIAMDEANDSIKEFRDSCRRKSIAAILAIRHGNAESYEYSANAFAEISGSYIASVVGVDGVYSKQIPLGSTVTATVSKDGVLSVNKADGASVIYRLKKRIKDGSYITSRRALPAGIFEFGVSTSDYRSFTVSAQNKEGVNCGTITYSCVKK